VGDPKCSPNYHPFASHKTTDLEEGSWEEASQEEEDSLEKEDREEVEDTQEEAHQEQDPLEEAGDPHQFPYHNHKQEN